VVATTVTSVMNMNISDKPIIKTIHHIVNITFTEAKLFAITCGINQATNIPGILKIVVITDSLHTTQRIFDSLSYSFQIRVVSILDGAQKILHQRL